MAYLAAVSRLREGTPKHFALQHRITNNPSIYPFKCTDGWEGKLLVVDDTDTPGSCSPSLDAGLRTWFPKAVNDDAALHLMMRITYEGNLLPILTSLSFVLLAEMYTTTSSKGSQYQRVRLQYKSSPISDFGITRGTVTVLPQDRLVYYKKSDKSFVHGQDPNEHYWLWFRTIRGHEITLDVGMLPFDMGIMVDLYDCFAGDRPFSYFAPAYFRDREIRKAARKVTPPGTQTDAHCDGVRISVLRDQELHSAVLHSYDRDDCRPNDQDTIGQFMQRVAGPGRTVSPEQVRLACKLIKGNAKNMAHNLNTQAWKHYRPKPVVGFSEYPATHTRGDEIE